MAAKSTAKTAPSAGAASSVEQITAEQLDLLAQSFLFSGVPKKRLLAALKNCRCLRLPAKKVVFRRGETGKEMYIILSGGVKVSALSAGGKEIIFDLLSEGDFFGELSLLDGGGRAATVATLVPSTLVALERDFLMAFLENNPGVSIRLLHLLAYRFRVMDTFLEEVLFFDSETRLAKRVMALKDIYGKAVGGAIQIELKVSQQDIANLVGITRERVNQHLKKWERAKIIDLQQGRLTIQKPMLLQRLANEAGSLNILKV